MSTVDPLTVHVCSKCGASNAKADLEAREYRCANCGFELAHLDVATNGVIRGIFGMLRTVGDVIQDRYRVKSVLGKGGFGVTYLVEDLRLNGKRRALKEVPELLFDEYETTLLSRLSHPSIPDIIDRSVSNGMVYFVLEFGGTRTLGDERKRLNGRIPVAAVMPWMRQLCDVLHYLHSQDPPIIHRDLKPDNVLIDDNERVMLIDFGIAKESIGSTATRTIGRAATHGFSPPEQVMGTGTDPRSDVYSLAATIYSVVTGEIPPAAHERVAGKPLIPAKEFAPEMPAALDEALTRAMNLNINERQQTILELAQVLNAPGGTAPLGVTGSPEVTARTVMVTERPASVRATKPPSIRVPTGDQRQPASPQAATPLPAQPTRSWLPLTAAGAVLALAAAGGIYYWTAREKTEPPQTATVTPALPAVTTPNTAAAPTPAAAVPTQTTAVNTPAPATTPPGGSALEALEEGLKNKTDTAPPTRSNPVLSTLGTGGPGNVDEPKPRIKPKPKPKPKTEPQAAPDDDTATWTIIPGGARQTN